MPRNREEVRLRLQQAALELYRERGYDRTTSAEIAAKAGVTERTFFRHFADKREILFAEDPALRPALAKAIAEAPDSLGPLEVALAAFASIETMLRDNRPFTEPRAAVIAANPALVERAEAKSASIAAFMASRLQARGVEPKLAMLAARTGMAAFSHAASAWAEEPSAGLEVHLQRTLQTVHGLSGTGG